MKTPEQLRHDIREAMQDYTAAVAAMNAARARLNAAQSAYEHARTAKLIGACPTAADCPNLAICEPEGCLKINTAPAQLAQYMPYVGPVEQTPV